MPIARLARLAAFAALLAAAPASALAADCFHTRDWRGSSALDDRTLLLRVNDEVYRLDVSGGAREIDAPDSHLVFRAHGGGDFICRASDLDLTVANTAGFSTALVARTLRKLTPAEVAAIPPRLLP